MAGLYILDYGAGNVQSLANTLSKLGHTFTWISSPEDFHKASSLIFPGVGAFGTAIAKLKEKNLFEPLREYIRSGKPYLGICIGLQVLYESSEESPSSEGLAIIPAPVQRFVDADKSVPHIGWNQTDALRPTSDSDIEGSSHYYFVHSYCAKYDPSTYPEAARWVHATSQYGQEVFVATVLKDNVFGAQFHPEKSGPAGLKLIDTWLKRSRNADARLPPCAPVLRPPNARDGLTKRIVACMDVRANDQGDLIVTKGDQYDVREKVDTSSSSLSTQTAGAVRHLGKPVALAEKYYLEGADEICLLNITSFRHSPLHDQPMLAVVRAAAERVFVPLTIGGGIKDTVDPDGTKRSALEVAGAYFRAGADKVSIGSEAVYAAEKYLKAGRVGDGTSAIETIAHAYGRQAVVVSIDPRRVYVDAATYDGPFKDELVYGTPESPEAERNKAWWYQCTVSGGRESRDVSVVQLAQASEALGAGELLINSIDRDGTGLGFDLGLIQLIKNNVKIPIVASSGAGKASHFVDVFENAGAEAALAAGIFHRKEVSISDVKHTLKAHAIAVRPEEA